MVYGIALLGPRPKAAHILRPSLADWSLAAQQWGSGEAVVRFCVSWPGLSSVVHRQTLLVEAALTATQTAARLMVASQIIHSVTHLCMIIEASFGLLQN